MLVVLGFRGAVTVVLVYIILARLFFSEFGYFLY